ncbi:MAG: hypothetical protein U9Q85_00645, partial [Patescibacteria group bacterium]|nr:hypothetical protein [Patescibacteria group bacterium]
VLRYRLPSKVDSNTYELLAQKQPGTLNASLYYTLCPNTEISLINDAQEVFTNKNPFSFRSNLNIDKNIKLRIKQ